MNIECRDRQFTVDDKLLDVNAPQRRPAPDSLAAIPGIVFAGSVGGHDRAYDTRTGEMVWDLTPRPLYPGVSGAPANGGSLAYGAHVVGDDMLFVDSGAPGFHEGKALLAFSVDRK